LARTFLRMEIELDAPPPAPVWPDGITARIMRHTEDDLRRAWAVDQDAFRDHWGFMPLAFEKWRHLIASDPHFDPTLFFFATTQTPDGEQIVGGCFCRPQTTEDPDMAFVNDLGVRRAWRRQGIALALLRHAFAEFYRRGQRKAGLGVDATSLTGALDLYRKAGMRETRRYLSYEKELRAGEELSTQDLAEE
jgi:ribosomal protein S18 acetylase RimI-like enzyme